MKKHSYVFIAVLLTLLGAARLNATNPDSASAKSFEKYKVRLIRNNAVVDSLLTERNKPFCFFLRKDGNYALDVTREGDRPVLMPVNTSFSGQRPRQSYFKFTLTAIPAGAVTRAAMVFDERQGGFCSAN